MKEEVIICHIREQSLWAWLAARKLGSRHIAVAMGRNIHLWNTDKHTFLKDPSWVKHELCHVQQFRRYGFLRFLYLYLMENIRKGYVNNKFEKEARMAETENIPDENMFEFH